PQPAARRDVPRGGARGPGDADARGRPHRRPLVTAWREVRYRCTTGQVSVRVIPSTAWTRATTSLPRSSTLSASARTITSYGPVTSSADCTPSMSAIALATWAALPTSVWIRMYTVTIGTPSPEPPPLALPAALRLHPAATGPPSPEPPPLVAPPAERWAHATRGSDLCQ